jgi:hypothetical protein
MDNIYKDIEKLLNPENDRPIWVDEILYELREIKSILTKSQTTTKKIDKADYYEFVKNLRDELKADIANDIYPEILYKGRKYGINFKGFIYDKEDSMDISTNEAFEIYNFLYKNRENLDRYIKK